MRLRPTEPFLGRRNGRGSRSLLACAVFASVNCVAVLVLAASAVAAPGTPLPAEFIPKLVPYLDVEPSAVDGQGTATLRPSGPVPIGSRGDFAITFTVGEAGVVAGGYVLLQVSPWWGWTEPQTEAPEAPGYVQATTSFDDPSFEVTALPLNRVLAFSRERRFEPDDTITFRYGNARVDKFAEAEELFQVFVDADGDGHAACIAQPPTLTILPGEAQRLVVNAPSIVPPGDPIEITAAAVDALGNWADLPQGMYVLKASRDGKPLDADAPKVASDKKSLSVRFTPREAGVYSFDLKGPSGLEGRSNVMLCQTGTPRLNLYFGDIHGHSRLSDGTGTPEDYYRFAREVSGLHVAALTDHADYGTIPIEGAVWKRIRRAANQANEPGRFVTFLGFEWTNWTYGHRNVYYRDGDGPVFRSIDSESDTPQELWELLQPHEAMTIAHHVGGGPVRTDWTIAPGPKEWLVEICSIHGCSEFYGGEATIYRPVRGAFVRDALERGYRLGILGGGDTHDGHPGQRTVGTFTGGLLGVYAPELTREAVWEAFRERRVYGTSGPKIILNFRVADRPMGSEVTWPADKGPIPILCRAIACAPIRHVQIVRNGQPVYQAEGDGPTATFVVEDPAPPAGVSWYYARVVQEDTQMAWSSPVWVTLK